MKIHEYQGKELLRAAGVPVPLSQVAFSAAEAKAAAAEIIRRTGNEVVVVKSQIHAGGRGKGRFKEYPELGGVKVVKGDQAAHEVAEKMLGSTLVTIQTGDEGKKVQRLLIEQGMNIARELYIGLTLDRATSRVTIMASTEGGMDIEEVAEHTPEKILREAIDPAIGLAAFQARGLAYALGLRGATAHRMVTFLQALAGAYERLDAALFEINPLRDHRLRARCIALDAKVTLRRQRRVPPQATSRACATPTRRTRPSSRPRTGSSATSTSTGDIGCMVNGAGLAMATMDIIKYVGAEPGELPRRRRRSDRRARHRRLQAHHQGPLD
jgi:succinyl-CoA synthetase beta subunit